MEAVFTYGTLEIPAVMMAVTGRSFESHEARALNFARFLLKDRHYPGMIPTLDQETCGRVYLNVDVHSLWLLDQFEDKIYRKKSILVQTSLPHATITALAYIIPPEQEDDLSPEPWEPQKFIDRYLCAYLEACRQFHRGRSGQMTNGFTGASQPMS